MHLTLLDWLVVAATLIVCFGPALFFGRRAGKNTSEYFASGRAVPWWLAGLSMVATTFSADTPNLVTDIVRRNGVAGNWVWWAFVLTGVSTVFFYARLWRRSGVLTDLEFYEIRYSGRAASAVRGFRAVYLGLFFNCMIMASVNLAACKIAGVLFGLDRWQTLTIVGVLNVAFAAHAGLWGVLVIDMTQFFLKMAAVIAAAYFAVNAPAVGGLHQMVAKISQLSGPGGLNYLSLLPDFRSNWDLAVAVFVLPITVQWWAVWYPGSEPGGGSYIAQRMLASKTEGDALGAVLFFNIAHYVLRPWPWILVALASLIVYPTLGDIQHAFPHLDPRLLGHDVAYPAMLTFLPAGFLGLMVGGLIAASSSTLLTHLNWGASYLVHDFYRRFIRPDAAERHYVRAGRIATVGLFLCGAGIGVPARQREERVRSDSSNRRGNRSALPRAMVLVARDGLVRDRRDGQLVSRVGVPVDSRAPRTRGSHRRRARHHRRPHDRVLAPHGVSRTRNRSCGARRVLRARPAPRTGMGAAARGGRATRGGHAAGRQHAARAPRLDLGLGGDLVSAFCRRQLLVRAHARGGCPHRHLHRRGRRTRACVDPAPHVIRRAWTDQPPPVATAAVDYCGPTPLTTVFTA